MQGFESESFSIGGDHSQKVKAPPIENDYGSKDCVNLPSSTAVSRLKPFREKAQRKWLLSGSLIFMYKTFYFVICVKVVHEIYRSYLVNLLLGKSIFLFEVAVKRGMHDI
jgi:hypothetical protein